MNKFLKRFLQGIILGAALITAVGGGTTAVLLGVYDDIIESIADFTKNPRKSLQLIIPMGLGGALGILALIIPLRLLMKYYPFIGLSLFVGLTIGGFRVFKNTVSGHITIKNLLFSLAGFAFVFSMGAITWFSNFQTNLAEVHIFQIFLVFIVAFLSTGAHVSPGISGTLLLIAAGYFNELIDLAKRFIFFESIHFWFDFSLVMSFVVGSFLGLFLISKLYKFSFAKSRIRTNFTILGFIIGSISIVYFNGQIKPEYANIVKFDFVQFIICVALIIVGSLTTNYLLKLAEKSNKPHEETLNVMEE